MSSQKPDFTVDFEADFNSCGSDDVLSPPTPEFRKRIQLQQEKVFHSEAFLQPEPVKKQKTLHHSYDQRIETGQANMGDSSTQKSHQDGFNIHQEINAVHTSISDEKSRVEVVLRELGQDIKMLYLKWTQPFLEGEAFEALCPARLDELLKEAHKLEQHLKNEKEHMRERLTLLTQALQLA